MNITNLIMGTLGSFIAILCFAVLLECPKKYLPYAGIIGAVGGGVYLLSMECETGAVIASFLSALVIAFLSHTFARVLQAPVTIFLIPGILPTVPGAGMYRIVYYIMAGKNGTSAYYLVQTLEIAGMIALAVFLVGTFFKVLKSGQKRGENDGREEVKR